LAELLDYGVVFDGGHFALLAPSRLADGLAGTHIRHGVNAAMMGLTSVDHFRRTYGSESSEADRRHDEVRFVEVYAEARRHIVEAQTRTGSPAGMPDRLGFVGAHLSLNRSLASLRAVRLLYAVGLNPEADAVARQMLEQLAWAYAVDPLDDIEEINRVSSSKAVGTLRASVGPSVGRLYGELSRWAHMGRLEHHRSLREVDGGIAIIESEPQFGLGALRILALADWWVMIWEWVHRSCLSSFQATLPGHALRPNPDRPLLESIRRAERDLQSDCDGGVR
jgi:hypothetical protein